MKCMWSEMTGERFPVFSVCEREATHTCCDYGGQVCDRHKCRCSKPLEYPGDSPCIIRGQD